MPIYHLNGISLFYEEKGQGEPLIFLNGLSGDHLYWMGQLRFFSKQYRCLALDNRDVGQSIYGTGPYSIQDLAADVAGLMECLQLPPAHVVGLSMGGMIAQELALLAPSCVQSLILADTAARMDEWFRCTLNAFELIRKQVADTAAFFDAIMPWWVSHRFFADSERAEWLRWLLQRNPHPQPLDGFLRQLNAIRRHNALARLNRIDCPVLVLVGQDDMVLPVRYARELCNELPHSRLTVLSGVGHAPPIEDAKTFNLQVAQFLDEQRLPQRRPA